MGNLLSSNLYNLIKNKIFWAGIVLLVLLKWFEGDSYYYGSDYLNKYRMLEYVAMNFITTVLIICGVIPFVVGSDFDGGMIRNKIIAGFSRTQIYISNLISALVAAVIISIVDIGFDVIVFGNNVGFKRISLWLQDDKFSKLVYQLAFEYFMILIAFAAVSCVIMLISQNKAIAVVGILAIVFVFTVSQATIRRLATDPNPEIVTFSESGELVTTPNPYYVSPDSPMKIVYLSIDSIDIFDQLYYIPCEYEMKDPEDMTKTIKGPVEIFSEIKENEEIVSMTESAYGLNHGDLNGTASIPLRYQIGSAVLSILISTLGIIVFRRKNLK